MEYDFHKEEHEADEPKRKDEFEVDARKLPVPSVSLAVLKLLVTNRDGAMERYCEEIDEIFIKCLFPPDGIRFTQVSSRVYSETLAKARDYYHLTGTVIPMDLLQTKVTLSCNLQNKDGTDPVGEYFDSFTKIEIRRTDDYFDVVDEIIRYFRPLVLARAYAKDEYHRDRVLVKMNAINDRKRHPKQKIIKLSDDYIQKAREFSLASIPTGWPELDNLLKGGGMRQGCHLFVAPTGTGKTTFAVRLCYNMAQAGYRVLHINLECLALQVAQKMVRLLDDHPDKKDTVQQNYSYWSPDDELGISDIRMELFLAKQRGTPYDALVIDSLDLLKQDNNLDAFRSEEENAKALRFIAEEYNVVLWVTQQVNGDGLRLKADEEPTLYHVKGAKSVANPMVSVLFMWRSEEQTLEGTADAKLVKNRLGIKHCFRNIKYDNANLDISFADPLEYRDDPTSNFLLYDNR